MRQCTVVSDIVFTITAPTKMSPRPIIAGNPMGAKRIGCVIPSNRVSAVSIATMLVDPCNGQRRAVSTQLRIA